MNLFKAGGLRQKNLRYFFKGLKSLMFKKEFNQLSDDTRLNIRKSFLAVFSWVIMIVLSVIIVSYFSTGEDSTHSVFFNVVSALTNCGLSLGTLDQTLPLVSKFIFIFLMSVGRINISVMIMVFFLFVSKVSKIK